MSEPTPLLPCGHPADCEGLAGPGGDEPGCGKAALEDAVPPRSWFYTSERLPESQCRVSFWRTNDARSEVLREHSVFVPGDTAPWFGGYTTREALSDLLGRDPFPSESYVYAWEPEPAPPPLPDAPREEEA